MTKPEFTITRLIDAPLDLVWKAHTEAEHLSHWWGPKGLTLTVKKLDVRPGGVFHYAMGLPNGAEMYGVFNYHDIVPQKKLVFTNSFADADGNVTRAPFSPVWPLEVMNTWEFTEENGKTTLTLRGVPHNTNAVEDAAFQSMFASMQQGFGGTFDQLDTYLPTLKK